MENKQSNNYGNVTDLYKELTSFFSDGKKIVFVFMGNSLRTDDAVGVNIGEKLVQEFPSLKKILLVVAYNTPINFVGKIAKFEPDKILFVDGIIGGFEQGVIILATPEVIKKTYSTTTHYQEFEDIVLFLKDLYPYQFETMILGIQVANIGFMDEMTPSVKNAQEKVIHILKKVINEIENSF